jgi:pimeloyl-ACP methyl ester carboxylesterase
VPHIKLDAFELFYEVVGEGPPLLLLSGLGASRLGFAPVVPALARRYRVITCDNRGTGRSGVPPGPYSIDQMAADTVALIEHLGVGPVAVIGWSLGGTIVQSLLIDHRELLTAAVLLSTLPCYSELQHCWLDSVLALRRMGIDPLLAATAGAPWIFTPSTLTNHDRAMRILRVRADDPEATSDEAFEAQAAAIRSFDRRAELATVTTPTLVLVGAEDILTPPRQSIEIAQHIPHATLEVLPRGGHGMLLEYPNPTLGAINSFLEGHLPA